VCSGFRLRQGPSRIEEIWRLSLLPARVEIEVGSKMFSYKSISNEIV